MRINADFSQVAVAEVRDSDYVSSPQAGVERLMLDRIGDEVARATSIVRYAPRSSFNEHVHAAGEEFLVLEGVFSDEHADYPAGSYVRNPPGTRHSPHSDDGCRIFVKLRQFDESDLEPVVIDIHGSSDWQSIGDHRQLNLHRYESEQVTMRRFDAGHRHSVIAPAGGLEWLLLEGRVEWSGRPYMAETWWRMPSGAEAEWSLLSDCLIWEKTGHLSR